MSAYTIHLLECDFCKEVHTHTEEPVAREGWNYRYVHGEYGLCCPKCTDDEPPVLSQPERAALKWLVDTYPDWKLRDIQQDTLDNLSRYMSEEKNK